MYFMSMNNVKNKSFIYVDAWNCFDVNVVCSTAYGCRIDITLVSASIGHIFTIFIVTSGWFLLASAVVQYQRKIKLSNKLN